jgi:acetyltransferase-like isoleucine patch superfamily enzyme
MIIINKKPSILLIIFQKIITKTFALLDRLRWKSYYMSIVNHFHSFGDSVVIDYGVQFGSPANISIGNNVFIGKNVMINAGKGGEITISDGASIGAYSTIITWNLDNLGNRGLRRAVNKNTFKDVIIGKGVGVGYSVTINPGVVLGDGCEVAAGSVVTRSVKPYAIMAGSPAVLIGMKQDGVAPETINEENMMNMMKTYYKP